MRQVWMRLLAVVVLMASSLAAQAQDRYLPERLAPQAFASASDLFADPRVERWARMFVGLEHEALLALLAEDLTGPDPHPLAAHAWFTVMTALGQAPKGSPVPQPEGQEEGRAADMALALAVFQRASAEGGRDVSDLVQSALDQGLRDPMALTMLVWWAQGEGKQAIAARTAALWPEHFGPAWALVRDPTLTDPGGQGSGATLRQWMAQAPSATPFDLRQIVSAWLTVAPHDADAHRRMGYLFEETDDHEQARDAFLTAHALYPFDSQYAELIGRAMARLGQFDALDEMARRLAAQRMPPDSRERFAATSAIDALRQAGELGRARDRALVALAETPDDPALRVALAQVVLDEGRPAEAVDLLLPIALADDGHRQAYQLLAHAYLSLNRPAEAARVAQAYAATGRPMSAFQINTWAAALDDLGRIEDALSLQELLERDAPEIWALSNLAFTMYKAGRSGQAADHLAAMVRAGRFSPWIAAQLVTFATQAGRRDEALDLLREAARTHPHGRELWVQLARAADDPAAVWAEARDAAPRSAFPWIEAARLVEGQAAQGWREALEILDGGLAVLSANAALDGEIGALHDARALLLDAALQERQTRERWVMEAGLQALDEARDRGLAARPYWLGRYLLLGRFGEGEDYLRAVVNAAALHEPRAYEDLFRDNVHLALRLQRFPLAARARWVEREPRNGQRLREAANLHTLYGGSPVVALSLLNRAERADPNLDVSIDRGRAYAALGLHRQGYEATYGRATSVPDSDRYIGWEVAARRNARAAGTTLQSLDLERMRVVLRRPDGIEEERAWHPQTGELIYLRVGAAWVAFDHEDGLELTGIESGDGRRARIEYEAIPLDPVTGRRVVGLQIDGYSEIEFAYGTNGQISEIAIAGLGRVEVDSDEAGEVLAVRSFPETHEDGFALSAAITQAFQVLVGLTGMAEGRTGFASLPFVDPQLDALREAHRQRRSAAAALDLAEGLLARRAAHPDHADELFRLVEPLIWAVIDADGTAAPGAATDGLHAIRLWHAMTVATRAEGLDPVLWDDWAVMLDWAQARGDDPDPGVAAMRRALLTAVEDAPLRRRATSGWLRSSFLSNPGLWRHHRLSGMVPPTLARDAGIEALLIRSSGDLVIGTRRGLSVRSRGFFEWLPYDPAQERLNPALDLARVDGWSHVQALAEDPSGTLWIGTRAGLLRVSEGYTDTVLAYPAGQRGMPEGGVSTLLDLGDTLFLAGPGGVALLDRATDTTRLLDRETALWARALPDGQVAVGRLDRVEIGPPDALRPAVPEQLDDVIAHDGIVYALRGTRVLTGSLNDAGLSDLRLLPEQETIAHAGRVHGFSLVPIFADTQALAVRTDQGLSILRDGRFEHLRLPGRDRIEPAPLLHARDTVMAVATPEGVAMMEDASARLVIGAQVHAMHSAADLGMTLVAWDWGIAAVSHAAPFAWPQPVAHTASTALARAPDGSFITNDGATILRLTIDAPAEVTQTALFTAAPHDGAAPVRQILAGRDGAIWVVAGASVFRLAPGADRPDEFSIHIDAERFGANSDMPSRLIETETGAIWLVASNEGHRTHRGRPMSGGLHAFDGWGFRRHDWPGTARWFLTGYTALPDRAILGTTGGFAVLRNGVATSLSSADDPSYAALRARVPGLHLGTDGVDLGDGLYLFGTQSGIVGLRDGVWFYPERLNWMLPEQQHAAYGGRAIRQLATDPMGRIYVITDFGLTIHDPQGAGPESFLIDHADAALAFAALETRKMTEVRDILLDALPPESSAGQRLDALRTLRRQIAELEQDLDIETARGGGETQRLARQVLQLRQRDLALLADLERSEPELFALVQVNPLDLAALRRDLPTGTVVLQYLPGRSTLYLNLLSRDLSEVHRIDLSAADLEARVRQAVAAMAAQARGTAGSGAIGGLPGASGLGGLAGGLSTALMGGSAGLSASLAIAPGPRAEETGLTADLAFLYDHLLRPVEHTIQGFDTVLIAPVGVLNYLPFGALVRDSSGAQPHYAVQDATFAKIPNLYAVQSMLRARPSTAFGHLVLGDPDGTLPQARQEAAEIAAILGADDVALLTGDDANLDALVQNASAARFVHLAMHGKLDHESPRNSYLLLGEGRRLTLPQIMTLPLDNADLVFLSACETALGTDGLEHRTIAQAFNHAGAPTIIASHWQVDDAATRALSTSFYRTRMQTEQTAAALAAVQRAMISAGGDFAKPGYWAGFSVFGRP